MDNPYDDNSYAKQMIFDFFAAQLEKGKTSEQALDNALDYWVEELGGNIVFSSFIEDIYELWFEDQFTERDSIVDAG